MSLVTFFITLLSTWIAMPVEGFSVPTDRRCFLSQAVQKVTASGVLTSLVISSPPSAIADVSDGNALPDGAAQFSRLVRLKSDIVGVNKRLATNAGEIQDGEWDNISDFMRLTYRCGDDMKLVASTSINEAEKKKRAEEDIKVLQKLAQASDGPISKRDAEGLLSITKKVSLLVDDFFDLLRDVPDEL